MIIEETLAGFLQVGDIFSTSRLSSTRTVTGIVHRGVYVIVRSVYAYTNQKARDTRVREDRPVSRVILEGSKEMENYGTCDKGQCEAGALVKVTVLPGLLLVFCSHHAEEAAKKGLRDSALVWDDSLYLEMSRPVKVPA